MIIDDNTPVFVLAGDMAQARRWIRQNVRYVQSPEILLGHENPILVRVGTWYKRKDRDVIADIVMSQTRNFPKEEAQKQPAPPTNKQSLQLLSDKIHSAVLDVTGDQPETECIMESINVVLAQQ